MFLSMLIRGSWLTLLASPGLSSLWLVFAICPCPNFLSIFYLMLDFSQLFLQLPSFVGDYCLIFPNFLSNLLLSLGSYCLVLSNFLSNLLPSLGFSCHLSPTFFLTCFFRWVFLTYSQSRTSCFPTHPLCVFKALIFPQTSLWKSCFKTLNKLKKAIRG